MPGTGWTLKSYGFFLMVGFLSAVWLAMRRAMKVKCDPDVVLNCSFISLVVGIGGSRIFYVVHYWKESFADQPNPLLSAFNITQGGLEFLGGLVPAMIAVPLYLRLSGKSIRVYTDILAVSTAWGLGIARLGCFLNGCCFGSVCIDAHNQPLITAAVQFPFASPALIRQWERRQITLPAELIDENSYRWEAMPLSRDMFSMSPEAREKPFRELERAEEIYLEAKAKDPKGEETKRLADRLEVKKKAAKEHESKLGTLRAAKRFMSRSDPSRASTVSELRSLAAQYPALWSHPTQLYSSVAAVLLSVFLGRVFWRRKRHGMVFGLLMVTYPPARFALEIIRADNPLDTFGMTVSQAVSVAMLVLGCAYLFVLYRFFPERSPRAIPFVPQEENE